MVVSRITECMIENGHGVIDWITECVFGITVNSLSKEIILCLLVSPLFPFVSIFVKTPLELSFPTI
jgi:hypothetical protein